MVAGVDRSGQPDIGVGDAALIHRGDPRGGGGVQDHDGIADREGRGVVHGEAARTDLDVGVGDPDTRAGYFGLEGVVGAAARSDYIGERGAGAAENGVGGRGIAVTDAGEHDAALVEAQGAGDVVDAGGEEHGAAVAIGLHGEAADLIDRGLDVGGVVAGDGRNVDARGDVGGKGNATAFVAGVAEIGDTVAVAIGRVGEPTVGVIGDLRGGPTEGS